VLAGARVGVPLVLGPDLDTWGGCVGRRVVRRETGHTHKHITKNNTTHDTTRTTPQQHNTRHDKNTTNDHTNNPPPPHLTTIEGDAATVRTTSHKEGCDAGILGASVGVPLVLGTDLDTWGEGGGGFHKIFVHSKVFLD